MLSVLIKAGRLRIKLTPSFAVFFAVAANAVSNYTLVYSLVFAVLHEGVHYLCLRRCGCPDALIEFLPGGIRLYASGMGRLSYKKTVFCTLGAPVFNILAGACFFALYSFFGGSFFYQSAVINFLLGGMNVLPLGFLDGGRALGALLGLRLGCFKVRKIISLVSAFVIFLLTLLFFVCFFMKKYYIFLMVFCVYCVLGCFCDKSG